ncbi:hypothetical protein RA307_30595 [Xanthobacteraceae bacterium Astr-EGSB]|uniref:hypothetical protein n=1 Tax=Astrobacterium formosum TaxID=3069710 RepID=UPI0027B019FD|nr:hypothetical protein [Xanthobacteraceae bacterium Astr-EGSB]
MTRISLQRQIEAVTLAHFSARHQLAQRLRTGGLSEPERDLKQQHILALRAARETLLVLVRDQAPGIARLHHDAMVQAASIAPEEFADIPLQPDPEDAPDARSTAL